MKNLWVSDFWFGYKKQLTAVLLQALIQLRQLNSKTQLRVTPTVSNSSFHFNLSLKYSFVVIVSRAYTCAYALDFYCQTTSV